MSHVQKLLELTGLSAWANSMPGELGRNWQKRVGLARALILQPEVLLLDTPLNGLDLRHINWWLNFLGQLSAGHDFMNGRRMTLVVTAEDLRPWKNLAGHFAILQKKRFIVLGHCPKLAGHPEPLVNELLAEDPARKIIIIMPLQDLTPQLRTRLNRMERAVGWFIILATVLLLFGFGYYIYNTAERRGWFKIKAPYFTYAESGAWVQRG